MTSHESKYIIQENKKYWVEFLAKTMSTEKKQNIEAKAN